MRLVRVVFNLHDPAGARIRLLQCVPGDAVLLGIEIGQINLNLDQTHRMMSSSRFPLRTHIAHVGLLLSEQRRVVLHA